LDITDEDQKTILCDPQTSGGLLIAVSEEASAKVENLLKSKGLIAHSFGKLVKKMNVPIQVLA